MTLFLVNGKLCIAKENGFQTLSESTIYEMVERNEIHEVITVEHD